MNLLIIILLAVGLGMDVLSVCAAIGVRWNGWPQIARLSTAMGTFQFGMPLIGYFVGIQLAGPLAQWGRFVAAALLAGLGIKMLVEAIRNRPAATADEIDVAVEQALHMHPEDPTHGHSLIILSIATSLDALLAGFTLAIYDTNIWEASVIIGMVSAVMAIAGVMLGRFIGKALGRPAEFLGAFVLIGLAVKFLVVNG